MRVICAAGKGEMEDFECLKCAEKRQNICGYDLSLLKAMFDDQEPRPDIHVTDLTGCLLKSYYDKKDPSPRYVQDLLLLSLGIAAHANLETGNGGPLYMSEMPLAADGVVGRTDVYYYSGRIIDYKTTRWIDPEKLPYGTRIDQVNIYAYLLKRMGYKVTSAAIQYIDMSGPTKCRKCKIPYRWTDGKISCQKCGESLLGSDDRHTGCPRPHGMAELLGIKSHDYLLHDFHHNGEGWESQDYDFNTDELLTLGPGLAKVVGKRIADPFEKPWQGCSTAGFTSKT